MKAVVQRVKYANVKIDNVTIAGIAQGNAILIKV